MSARPDFSPAMLALFLCARGAFRVASSGALRQAQGEGRRDGFTKAEFYMAAWMGQLDLLASAWLDCVGFEVGR